MKRCRPLLGTFVEIRATGANEAVLASAIDAAFDAVARVHRLMSFHDADSDLARLHRDAHRMPVTVDAWTWQVLDCCRTMHAATGGLFDCTVADKLVERGYLPAVDRTADVHTDADAHALWSDEAERGMRAIQLLPDNQIRFMRPLLIDLGGIAKGFAVDKAIDTLRAHGVQQAVVNAGGDLRVLGDRPEPVLLRDPAAPGHLLPLGEIADGAVATSASYFVAREHGREASVLIDPRTGAGVGIAETGSCSVIAPTCIVADALTKALAIERRPQAPYFAAFDAHAVLT